MASEWEYGRLDEIIDFLPSRTIKKGLVAPFIAMADIPENSREPSNISQKEFKGGGSKFCNGDTVFARITPCLQNGKTAKIPGLIDGQVGHGSTEFIVLGAKESTDQDYIYYLSRLQEFRRYAESRMEGSTGRQRVSWQALSEYELYFPTKKERRKIGHFLSLLDNKIELNRQTNQTLEKMAQALFKSWFVDFDPVIDNALEAGNTIPDELQDHAERRQQQLAKPDHQPLPDDIRQLFPSEFELTEALGWVPMGWEVKTLGASFELLGGHPFKSSSYLDDGNYGVVTIRNVQDGVFVQECANRTSDIPEKMKAHCSLSKGDVLLSLTGNVGRVCIVSEGDYLLNQRVAKILGKDAIPKSVAYFFFRQESLYKQMITIAKGTAQQNLSPIETIKIMCVLPSNFVLAKLSSPFEALFEKMTENTVQSQTLTSLRDTLLPKLISGELRLPSDALADAEQQPAAVTS